MLFLVVSNPRPERPTEVAEARLKFWPWIGKYQAEGICRHIYARVGRGAVAVFDVPDHETLHRVLGEWGDLIPAEFETFPLIDTPAALEALARQRSEAD